MKTRESCTMHEGFHVQQPADEDQENGRRLEAGGNNPTMLVAAINP